MRDALTFLGFLAIALLVAALAVPPLIDWEGRRDFIDSALTRASGIQAQSEGRIGLRLLPSPLLKLERARFASDGKAFQLDARHLTTEIALMPLLKGEVHFLETRIAEAVVKMPGNRERLAALFANGLADRSLEALTIARLELVVEGARRDSYAFGALRISAESLVGPWRLEGQAQTAASEMLPFKLTTGAVREGQLALKLNMGGGTRLEAEGALNVKDGLALAGSFRWQDVSSVPAALQGSFKSVGSDLALDNLSFEAGEGPSSLRLTGTGRVVSEEKRILFKLEGRRFDIDDSVFERSRLSEIGASFRWPVEIDVAVDALSFSNEDIGRLSLKAVLERKQIWVEAFELKSSDGMHVSLSGAAGAGRSAMGRVTIDSEADTRWPRLLAKLGAPEDLAPLFEGRAFSASADVTSSAPVSSLRNLKLSLGDLSLAGTVRHTAAENGSRPRIDAQLMLQGIDLARLPRFNEPGSLLQRYDLGLALEARGVRLGNEPGLGRIAARISSENDGLILEPLEIDDVAGVNARISGRIAPEGQLSGQLMAQKASPLIEAIMKAFGASSSASLVPSMLREAPLNLGVRMERKAGSSALTFGLDGAAAGGTVDAHMIVDDAIQSFDGRFAKAPSSGQGEKPIELTLKAERQAKQLKTVLRGEVAGTTIDTVYPLVLNVDAGTIGAGELRLASPDLRPALALLSIESGFAEAVPADLRLSIAAEPGKIGVEGRGRVANENVEGKLEAQGNAVFANLKLDRLSMPWLVSTFGTGYAPDGRGLWPSGRFSPSLRTARGELRLNVRRIDLGRGFLGEEGAFLLTLKPEAFSIKDFNARLSGGRLTGSLNVAKQGSLVSLTGNVGFEDLALGAILSRAPFGGQVAGNLRFGASGESLAGLISSLSGGGEVRLANLLLPSSDPAGVERAIQRISRESAALSQARLTGFVNDEIAKDSLFAVASAGPVSLNGGTLRAGPLTLESAGGSWKGTAIVDFRSLGFEARGTLMPHLAPAGWSTVPVVMLNWKGPVGAIRREVEAGALLSVLTANNLKRELDRIDTTVPAPPGRPADLEPSAGALPDFPRLAPEARP